MCVPNGCTKEQYTNFLSISLRDLFKHNSKDVTTTNYSVILLDEINPYNANSKYDLRRLLLNLIPPLLLCIQVILVVLKVVPFCLFKVCFKKKKQHSNEPLLKRLNKGLLLIYTKTLQ